MHVSAFVLNNASFTAKYKESAVATCRNKSAVNSNGFTLLGQVVSETCTIVAT